MPFDVTSYIIGTKSAHGGKSGINLVKTIDVEPVFDAGSTSKTTVTITDVPENSTVFAIMKESDSNLLSPDGTHYNYWAITSAFYKIKDGVIIGGGCGRNNPFNEQNGMVGGSVNANQILANSSFTNGVLTLTSNFGLAYNYLPTARYRFYVYDADISPRYI